MVTELNRRLLDSRDVDSARAVPAPPVEGPSISREAFSLAFDRSFGRVYSYVSRRIEGRANRERIVREVLVTNLALLIEGGDERAVAARLKASSDQRIKDQRIKEESARSLAAQELPS